MIFKITHPRCKLVQIFYLDTTREWKISTHKQIPYTHFRLILFKSPSFALEHLQFLNLAKFLGRFIFEKEIPVRVFNELKFKPRQWWGDLGISCKNSLRSCARTRPRPSHLALTRNLNEEPLVSEAARRELKRFLGLGANDNAVLM